MNRISLFFDNINKFFGSISAFAAIFLAFLVFYDAFMRYLFHLGSIALQELEWHFFDITFLFALGYTLKHDKHVRVDIFYEKFSNKTKEYINILDNLFLIIPFSLIIAYYSFDFTMQSFLQHEASGDPGGLCCRYIIKSAIFIGSILLLIQSISEIIKSYEKVKNLKFIIISLIVFYIFIYIFTSDYYFVINPSILMFIVSLIFLMLGFRVAFVFGMVAVLFAIIDYDLSLEIFKMLPMRIYGIMQNFTLMAVPLFILMGLILEKSNLAKNLLENLGAAFGEIRGGLAASIVIVGAILAAATGIVGASVVMMSIISLPIMLKYGYSRSLASGTIAASGTLGQIIPPSIVLIILGDVMNISVGDLFKAAIVPGLLLVVLYLIYIFSYSFIKKDAAPPVKIEKEISKKDILYSIIPPFLLIFAVLGSIFAGIATPTESAAMGVIGALILSILNKSFSFSMLRYVSIETVKLTAMIFMILIGATAFSLVFNEFGGGELVHQFFSQDIGSKWAFIFIAMLAIFLLGFFVDFVEISFIVVPLFVPIIKTFGIDPIWFAILIAMNLQASFLTPPFGFSLFYLKGAAGKLVTTKDIYKGVIPFIILQLIALLILIFFPNIINLTL
ncbi:TRAP transporter large permease subunit [Nitrosophilus kaiyonis]|uniref:TRAP transporter large permease subunit n=1 Tax=Nitrosophilus kaiyonis TaxID=2930200 RepID=UPI0024937BBA|nr:TRAP transporter large permease subunit [Nitrosophilus kaiyonis]